VNYRHAFHAANYADVLKHAILVRLIRALQRKERGFVFVDTHAGRGRYDLSRAARGDSKARRPEWPEGLGRLWNRSDAPAEVQDYLGIVRGFDRGQGNLGDTPRFYPGSPRIARLLARPQDRLELWEKHPAECAALRGEFAGERRVSVHEADGYGAVRACLPPAERRALVLLDPPFEAASEWSQVTAALGDAVGRFPGGTYAVWFPLTVRARSEGFLSRLVGAAIPSFVAELTIDPGAENMPGCGVAVVNPPWRFDEEARSILGYLAGVLALGQEAQGSVRWIVSE
jgi:23S rRNA (adenine2030-N6)-methyltransferase